MKIAETLMKKKLVTITSDASLLSAWELMDSNDIRHLPVCDEFSAVVGMITDRDIKRAMIVDRFGGDDEEVFLSPGRRVGDFMKVDLFLAKPETTMTDVIDEMLKRKVSSVIVVGKSGKPAGIITSTDIMRLCRDQLLQNEEAMNHSMAIFFPNTLY